MNEVDMVVGKDKPNRALGAQYSALGASRISACDRQLSKLYYSY